MHRRYKIVLYNYPVKNYHFVNWLYKIVLHDYRVKNYHFIKSYKESVVKNMVDID
jgi:hypothetical protein